MKKSQYSFFFISNISKLHLYKLLFSSVTTQNLANSLKEKNTAFLDPAFSDQPPQITWEKFNSACKITSYADTAQKDTNLLLLILVIYHKRRISMKNNNNKKRWHHGKYTKEKSAALWWGVLFLKKKTLQNLCPLACLLQSRSGDQHFTSTGKQKSSNRSC